MMVTDENFVDFFQVNELLNARTLSEKVLKLLISVGLNPKNCTHKLMRELQYVWMYN